MGYLSEKMKQNVVETLWLKYFNDTLYEQGLITEREYWEMNRWILNRKARQNQRAIRRGGTHACN